MPRFAMRQLPVEGWRVLIAFCVASVAAHGVFLLVSNRFGVPIPAGLNAQPVVELVMEDSPAASVAIRPDRAKAPPPKSVATVVRTVRPGKVSSAAIAAGVALPELALGKPHRLPPPPVATIVRSTPNIVPHATAVQAATAASAEHGELPLAAPATSGGVRLHDAPLPDEADHAPVVAAAPSSAELRIDAPFAPSAEPGHSLVSGPGTPLAPDTTEANPGALGPGRPGAGLGPKHATFQSTGHGTGLAPGTGLATVTGHGLARAAPSNELPGADGPGHVFADVAPWLPRQTGKPIRTAQSLVGSLLRTAAAGSPVPSRGIPGLTNQSPSNAEPVKTVYLLDTSTSMKDGRKLSTAILRLKQALSELQPTDQFDVVTFYSAIQPEFDRLVPATAANIKQAMLFIDTAAVGNGTNLAAAVETGLSIPFVKHICILTDGDPNIGPSDSAKLRAELIRANHNHAHVVAIGLGEAPEFKGAALLQALAADSAGRYIFLKP